MRAQYRLLQEMVRIARQKLAAHKGGDGCNECRAAKRVLDSQGLDS